MHISLYLVILSGIVLADPFDNERRQREFWSGTMPRQHNGQMWYGRRHGQGTFPGPRGPPGMPFAEFPRPRPSPRPQPGPPGPGPRPRPPGPPGPPGPGPHPGPPWPPSPGPPPMPPGPGPYPGRSTPKPPGPRPTPPFPTRHYLAPRVPQGGMPSPSISNNGQRMMPNGMMRNMQEAGNQFELTQRDMKKMEKFEQKLKVLADRLGQLTAHLVSLLAPALLVAIILCILCCWHRQRRHVASNEPYQRMTEGDVKSFPV